MLLRKNHLCTYGKPIVERIKGVSFPRRRESRVFIHRYFHIDHPRTGYSALSVSTSTPSPTSLFAFPFETQIPTIRALHTKPGGEHPISGWNPPPSRFCVRTHALQGRRSHLYRGCHCVCYKVCKRKTVSNAILDSRLRGDELAPAKAGAGMTLPLQIYVDPGDGKSFLKHSNFTIIPQGFIPNVHKWSLH